MGRHSVQDRGTLFVRSNLTGPGFVLKSFESERNSEKKFMQRAHFVLMLPPIGPLCHAIS